MEKMNEVEVINNLVRQFGNDQDLAYKGKLDEFCKKYPNDFDLGRFLRKKIKN
jgi:hypothetical protein